MEVEATGTESSIAEARDTDLGLPQEGKRPDTSATESSLPQQWNFSKSSQDDFFTHSDIVIHDYTDDMKYTAEIKKLHHALIQEDDVLAYWEVQLRLQRWL